MIKLLEQEWVADARPGEPANARRGCAIEIPEGEASTIRRKVRVILQSQLAETNGRPLAGFTDASLFWFCIASRTPISVALKSEADYKKLGAVPQAPCVWPRLP
jgi:hypothetical protein